MGKSDDSRYGIVLDAGSSGTRVYVYKWLNNSKARQSLDSAHLHVLPVIETRDKWTKKVHPGVSTFGEKPELVGPDHLKDLLDHALKYVPKEAVEETPIFLLATAGMRLLPDYQRTTLLANICSYMRSETKLLLPDCDLHIQVIPGETEGLYGWIAANYLLGGFDDVKKHDHGKGHHTYGFLDMGGASAQIAFAPNATEADKHANDLKLVRLRSIDGVSQEHRVFVTTWLGFGVNEARKRYVKSLIDFFGTIHSLELPDPCLPKGLLMTLDGKILAAESTTKPTDQHLIGTGIFDECMRNTFPLLEKDVQCLDEPCLINGVHVPAIDFDVNHFVGVSEYWHTTHEIFEMDHNEKAYDFNTYQHRVQEFCEQDWTTIESGIKEKQWGKKVDAQTAYEVCFKASWLINMLHEGIGIPRVGLEATPSGHNGTKEVLGASKDRGYLDSFQAVDKIKSTEVSWTLGKMVLYASADVPPITIDSAPVGFGSNEPGISIPTDFQYPGGGRLQAVQPTDQPPKSETSNSITDKFPSSIFGSDSPHRIPGFLFFLLIILIVLFCLCGRERRSRFYTSYINPNRQGNQAGKNAPASRLPSIIQRVLGRRTIPAQYEHALEDGAAERLYDPADFELGDLNESEDDLPMLKGGSGYDSPTMNAKRPKISSAKSAMAHLGPIAGRMSPEIMDRRGLVVRTESRENLGDIGGRKSRSGSLSPTRIPPYGRTKRDD